MLKKFGCSWGVFHRGLVSALRQQQPGIDTRHNARHVPPLFAGAGYLLPLRRLGILCLLLIMGTNRRFIVLLCIFALLTAALGLLFWPVFRELREPAYQEQFRRWIQGLGWKGVCALLGLQALQVVVAVIPGEPVELLAGAAYGALGGLALCLAGSGAASGLIFALVRRFGAPLAQRLISPRSSGRFAFLQNTQKTSLAVFILFLIPGTPKDTLTYLVPLSGMSLSRFLFISSLARVPSVLSSTLMGNAAIRGRWKLLLLVFAAAALTGLAGIVFSDRIISKMKSSSMIPDSGV